MGPAVIPQGLKLAGHIVNQGSLAASPVQQCLHLQPGGVRSTNSGRTVQSTHGCNPIAHIALPCYGSLVCKGSRPSLCKGCSHCCLQVSIWNVHFTYPKKASLCKGLHPFCLQVSVETVTEAVMQWQMTEAGRRQSPGLSSCSPAVRSVKKQT